MGYEPPAKQYQLKFEDHPGLEVLCESLTIGEFMSVAALADKISVSGTAATDASGAVEDLLTTFASHLVSWNVTKDGQPVTSDLAGVKTQNLDFILEIILAWVGAIASVDIPLPQASNGTGTSVEASMPMEALSSPQTS